MYCETFWIQGERALNNQVFISWVQFLCISLFSFTFITDLTAYVEPDIVRKRQNVSNIRHVLQSSWEYYNYLVQKWATSGEADAENSGRYTCAVEGQESVQSHPVFLDVQCEFVNETIMFYNKLLLLILGGFVYMTIET